MKSIFIFILFISSNSYTQWQWQWLNPIPTSTTNTCIYFINDSIGWASGYGGWIIKTYDGGKNWLHISKVSFNPNAIFFLDENYGKAVGDYGSIAATHDGGKSWYQESAGIILHFTSIWITSVDTAYITGNKKVLKTTNGGNSWFPLNIWAPDLNTIYFFDNVEGFAGGVDGIYKTSDGGDNWVKIPGTESKVCYDITFASDSIGFAAMLIPGYIAKTTDRGESWFAVIHQPTPLTSTILDISFSDINNGIAAGEHSKIIHTSDGGETWELQYGEYGSPYLCYAVQMIDPLNGIVLGDSPKIGILRTSDAGGVWTSQVKGYRSELNKIIFYDEKHGLAAGSQILKTSDGGANWISVFYDSTTFVYDIHIINETFTAAAARGSFLKSTDGGLSWLKLYSSPDNTFKSVYFFDENIGLLGADGMVMRTTTGGNQWIPVLTNPGYSVTDICFYDDLNGILLMSKYFSQSLVYKSIDGGITWSLAPLIPENSYLYDCTMLNHETWVIATGGKIYRTTNSGNTWNSSFVSSAAALYFFNENSGIAVGYTISTTNDGGITWKVEDHMGSTISSIARAGDKLYFAGAWGAILSSDVVLPTSLDEHEIIFEEDYLLDQNYPNPFNPITRIRYSLPGLNTVKISVYDILGNEIAVLVNELKPSGEYNVEWDASNFSSGVYFYRLQAGEFTSTKKLLLMK
jgi:photosystem II stability/assembly factor-like uncharacterized protein